jgi:hypothetical protein
VTLQAPASYRAILPPEVIRPLSICTCTKFTCTVEEEMFFLILVRINLFITTSISIWGLKTSSFLTLLTIGYPRSLSVFCQYESRGHRRSQLDLQPSSNRDLSFLETARPPFRLPVPFFYLMIRLFVPMKFIGMSNLSLYNGIKKPRCLILNRCLARAERFWLSLHSNGKLKYRTSVLLSD